jgi:EAL domain-containing protein (putative c-di-GMP-specific phosphodiesterase class I)
VAAGCGACSCSGVDATSPSGRLIVRSTVHHTLQAVARAARNCSVEATIDGSLCEITGVDLDAVALDVAASLSSPELLEARAVFVPDASEGVDRLRVGLSAVSLADLVGRIRHRELSAFVADESRFYARFQPIVDLGSRQTVAFEALLRAAEDDGSERSAGALFGGAEEAGLINLLDRIGREIAIRDAAPWLGERDLFINFVPTSIYRPEVCLATTTAAAKRHGVPTAQLVFEVVETHQVADVAHLLDIVAHYRSQGSRIALDDVGAGFGSLNLVAQVAPDVVKIDQQLVQMLPDEVSLAVVRALVEMTHAFGGRILAEGVETAEQATIATDLGVDLGQGWHFGYPDRAPDHAVAASGVN